MKKIIVFLLIFALCLGLIACGTATNEPTAPANTRTPAQPAATDAPTETQTEIDQPEIVGDDWRTWRSYTPDVEICDALTVCLSRLDDDTGYAVYDCSNGERIGTLCIPEGVTGFYDAEPFSADYDGDGYVDIGISTEDRAVWYCFDPTMMGSWPEAEGAFRELELPGEDYDETICYPFEEPEVQSSELGWEIYEEIYPKVVALEDFYYDVDTYGYDYMNSMLDAFGIIKTLHPETRNYFMLEEVNDDDMNFVGMRSRYSCRWQAEPSEDKEDIRAGMRAFDKSADEILAGLTDDMSAYEKYFYLAKAISENAAYDYYDESDCSEAPWAGIMGGLFICEGYSEAMEYLCRRANLYCKIVGGSSRGESHAWNLVKVPSGTYHVDVTWADEQGEPGSEGWMRYFMLSQEMIEQDHIIEDGTVATGW